MGKGRLDVYMAVRAALFDKEKIAPKIFSKKYLLVAPKDQKDAPIKIFNLTDDFFVKDFFVRREDLQKRISISAADFNKDQIEEIVVGVGRGGQPTVKVFDSLNRLKSQFFAYDKNFRGGVNVATGDIDNDGNWEIVTGAGAGGGPHVRIFDVHGRLKSQFFAYDKNFRGGVNVATGDIDNDGNWEIVTVFAAKAGNKIKIFNFRGEELNEITFKESFLNGADIAIMKVVD